MLNIPISGVETALFMAVLMIWAGLLFGGFIAGSPDENNHRRMPVWTRLASSGVLVIAAWIWFAISQGTQVDRLAAWIAIGMSLGFVGDVFMAQVFPLDNYVLLGMAAFGAGHIAYILGMIMVGSDGTIAPPNGVVLLIWWLIALIAWYVVVYRNSKAGLLHYAALPYSLLLATTCGVATSLALLDSAFILIAIGAILFLISDLILAAELFNRLRFPMIGDIIWLTYGPGQMLIVSGVLIYAMLNLLF